MKKHAYLIIAHTDEYCLTRLLECIDDERNDIYLLIDKKSSLKFQFQTQYSSFYLLERYDIRWGDISQVEAELRLLEAAAAKSHYHYYHLLSGQDLPIKTQDFIHNYFNSTISGENYIAFFDSAEYLNDLKERVIYRVPFTRSLRCDGIKGLLLNKLRNLAVDFQRHLGIKRKIDNTDFRKGANWFSITDEFARYVLSHRAWIIKTFSHIISSDELVLQTLIWNSPYKGTIHNIRDEYEGCMRAIDWNRGTPYVWRNRDYNELIASDKLFARKFDSKVDRDIIDTIFKRVVCKRQNANCTEY